MLVFPFMRGLPCNPRTNIESAPLREILELEKIYLASDGHVSFRRRRAGHMASAGLRVNDSAKILRKNIAVMDRKAPVSRGNDYQSSSVYYFDETSLCLSTKRSVSLFARY
jgi:hypothetical protein